MINHGAVSYGANTILTNINFEINAGQKIAVVGRNGCGKTTLLKLIEGEVELEKRDSDEDIYIAKSGNPVIGYLSRSRLQMRQFLWRLRCERCLSHIAKSSVS